MRHMIPRRFIVLMAVTAALPLSGCGGGEVTYVGESGIAHDGDGSINVYFHTCGEDITRVEVLSDKDVVVAYTTDKPASGAFTFVLGQQPPAPWSMEQHEPLDTSPDTTLTTRTTLQDEPKDVAYRDAEIQMEWLVFSEPGRINIGTQFKSGDRFLAWPEEWPDICRD